MSSCASHLSLRLESGATLSIVPIPHSTFRADESLALSAARQAERVTWQNSAREVLGDRSAEFAYNKLGAPYIVGSTLFIGVSHSATHAAVIISEKPCAVDIESLERNFERVKERYISPTEQLLNSGDHFLALAWSIKECVYKYIGIERLSLLDIEIKTLDNGHFSAEILTTKTIVSGSVTTTLAHSLAYID